MLTISAETRKKMRNTGLNLDELERTRKLVKRTEVLLNNVVGKFDAIELRIELLGEETTSALKAVRKSSIKSSQSILHVLDEHARHLDKLQDFATFLDSADTLLTSDFAAAPGGAAGAGTGTGTGADAAAASPGYGTNHSHSHSHSQHHDNSHAHPHAHGGSASSAAGPAAGHSSSAGYSNAHHHSNQHSAHKPHGAAYRGPNHHL